MAVLSDKLKNGIVLDKDMVVVCYDFDGKITSIGKIEYMDQKQYQTFLFEERKELDRKELIAKEEQEKLEKEMLEEQKKANKEKVLSAFDRWYRDVTNGIVVFDNKVYEGIINWYRAYLENNDIIVHKDLIKYL